MEVTITTSQNTVVSRAIQTTISVNDHTQRLKPAMNERVPEIQEQLDELRSSIDEWQELEMGEPCPDKEEDQENKEGRGVKSYLSSDDSKLEFHTPARLEGMDHGQRLLQALQKRSRTSMQNTYPSLLLLAIFVEAVFRLSFEKAPLEMSKGNMGAQPDHNMNL